MSDLTKRLVEAFVVLALVWMCLTLQGCQTINGAGRDLQDMTSNYVER